MCPRSRVIACVWFILFVLFAASSKVQAQAHYQPGVANIRDYSTPEPGLYLAVYNYGCLTSISGKFLQLEFWIYDQEAKTCRRSCSPGF